MGRQWGEFVGPENTVSETAATLAVAALGAGSAFLWARRAGASLPQQALSTLLAADLWGGAVANNTRACARWYERPGQGTAEHLRFSALHLHPFVVGPSGRQPGWVWAAAHYGYLQLATLGIRRAGRHRRVAGVLATGGGLLLDRLLGPSRTAQWFGPVFYTKLLLGHASAALWSDEDLSAYAGACP